jgi:hypothetical protein
MIQVMSTLGLRISDALPAVRSARFASRTLKRC